MAASEEKSESYRRIARAIRFLTAHTQAQPSLNEAARLAGLSPFHFQRQFSRLAGVSPKAFVCALTLDRAKRALRRGSNVFDAALDCGLSGTSRLHDLCLKIEAMTPGTYAKGGAGLDISYGFHPSIFGNALLMVTPRGLCGLAFADQGEEAATLTDMGARWPHARLIADDKATAPIAQRIFSQKGEIPFSFLERRGKSRCGKRCSTFPKVRSRPIVKSRRKSAQRAPHAPPGPPSDATPLRFLFRATACSPATARLPAIIGAWNANAQCWLTKRRATPQSAKPSTSVME